MGRTVINLAQTRTAPIDDAVVAAQRRVSDFLAGARVIPRSRAVAGSFDRSFNEGIFST